METARVLTISGLHPHCQGHIAILDSKLRSNETMFKHHKMDIAKTTWNESQSFAVSMINMPMVFDEDQVTTGLRENLAEPQTRESSKF